MEHVLLKESLRPSALRFSTFSKLPSLPSCSQELDRLGGFVSWSHDLESVPLEWIRYTMRGYHLCADPLNLTTIFNIQLEVQLTAKRDPAIEHPAGDPKATPRTLRDLWTLDQLDIVVVVDRELAGPVEKSSTPTARETKPAGLPTIEHQASCLTVKMLGWLTCPEHSTRNLCRPLHKQHLQK